MPVFWSTSKSRKSRYDTVARALPHLGEHLLLADFGVCVLVCTCLKNVNFIELGRYRMETWYFSPYPKEYYADGVVDTVRCVIIFVIRTPHRVVISAVCHSLC